MTDTFYLGGPMTGIPQFNFPAFDRAAERLRRHGYTIISPAELDNKETRESAMNSPDGAPGSGAHNGETWGDFLARDVKLIADKVDGAIFLNDWFKSKGARLEALVCTLKGKPVFRYSPDAPGLKEEIDPDEVGRAIAGDLLEAAEAPLANGETRVTSATGGQKGVKDQRMDLLPPKPLETLSEVYGMGAKKYDDTNYIKGYAWRLSLGAMMRHINLWAQGEDLDEESGLNHLAHAAWHCFTLQVFQNEELGEDDRLFHAYEASRQGTLGEEVNNDPTKAQDAPLPADSGGP